jgi:hypothetical protein
MIRTVGLDAPALLISGLQLQRNHIQPPHDPMSTALSAMDWRRYGGVSAEATCDGQ